MKSLSLSNGLICAALAALLFAGCATAPSPAPRASSDPRDPEVWRPTAPAVYPLPR